MPDLYEDRLVLQDIHSVSSLLKMYFRELPNPVIIFLDLLCHDITCYKYFVSSGLHLSPLRQVCGGRPVRRRCATSKASGCCVSAPASKLQVFVIQNHPHICTIPHCDVDPSDNRLKNIGLSNLLCTDPESFLSSLSFRLLKWRLHSLHHSAISRFLRFRHPPAAPLHFTLIFVFFFLTRHTAYLFQK